MLSFYEQIVAETHAADLLHVIARGLGMHQAASSFIASAVDDKSIILGVNISRPLATTVLWPALQASLQSLPSSHAPLLLPRFLNSDYTVRDRLSVYNACGFVVVTSAILVHDLLHNTLPVDRVRGIVILAADQVKERSNDHFALSLFRARNRIAFIKAFSENATALARGFHTVEKLMRLLYVSRLALWPRFHQSVRRTLRAHSPDLVDLVVQPSQRVATMITALRDTAYAVLNDLKQATRAIDFSELYVNAEDDKKAGTVMLQDVMPSRRQKLVYNFDDVVRRQLEGADAVISQRVRTHLADLTTLRALLRDAFTLDAVLFYQHVVTIRHAATRGHSWLLRKEAQLAILMARSRVWVVRRRTDDASEPGGTSAVQSTDGNAANENVVEQPTRPSVTIGILEPCPKWQALRDVLNEIKSDAQTAGSSADVGRVIIVVREQRMVQELKSVLTDGDSKHMRGLFNQAFPSIARNVARDEGEMRSDGLQQVTITQLALPEAERRKPVVDDESTDRTAGGERKRKRTTASKHDTTARGTKFVAEGRRREELEENFREIISESSTHLDVMIWCMEWVDVQGRGHRILDEYRPSFLILYNSDLAFVRQAEVYKANHPGRPVRLYLLSYDDSTEEQLFRRASEREKKAFKTLIRERATMTVHADQEGRLEEVEFTQRMLVERDISSSGRKGLGSDRDSRVSERKTVGKVIVDTRELRSSLPMLLYQSDLTIVPVTLEVADFVLSKDIGIERKSVPDLFGSFGSGRLFNQAEALCRHYKYPCLLIELDCKQSMSLTAVSGGVPVELFATSIVSKMVLLMQQFPTLKFLWAKGAHDAAALFAKLKEHESEPDVNIAQHLGVDTKESAEEESFNAGPKALLRSLPGIDTHNLNRVMRKVRNVSTLITMSEEEMTEVLGSAAKAALLFTFANERPSEALAAL